MGEAKIYILHLFKAILARHKLKKMSALKKLLPLADRVLVQKFAAETKTKGGILLPDSSKTKIHNAKVVAVGPGLRTESGALIPCSVSPGDVVLLPEYGGTKVSIEEDVEMLLFKDADILGKWEES